MNNHPRSRKVKEIVKKAWSEETITQAVHKIKSVPGVSIRSVAKEYGLTESTLRFRLKKNKKGEGLRKSGRKCAFPPEVEANLARCIGIVCNYGFSPSRKEVQEIVQEYVTLNNIDSTPFKDGRPGERWIRNFMKRNKLTMKRAEMISSVQISTTSNPFIIYDFYDMLEKVFEEYPELDAARIWNCDESGFPTDPSKGKVVCEKGKRALKQRPGAGCENVTVLAVCSASGVALDPLIIFKGKNMQTSWFGDEALPNTFYGKSESGWMDTEIFAEWFKEFADAVKERPLLLLFDGHLTHISVSVIQRAIEDQIIILKFPPHVTDVLQPLEVSCFGPLKRKWEQLLQERVNLFGATSALTKCDFVNQLCKIWNEGMKSKSIIRGFSSTGIYPVDRTKYPTNRLNKVKLQAYEKWKQTGEEINWDDVRKGTVGNEEQVGPSTAPQPGPSTAPQLGLSTAPQPGPSTGQPNPTSAEISLEHQSQSTSIVKPSNVSWQDLTVEQKLGDLLGPTPCAAPQGYYWKAVWMLAPESERQADQSFEERFLSRVSTARDKKNKPKAQAKMDFNSKVISHPKVLKKLTEMEEKKKAMEERKEAARLKKMDKELEKRKRKREEESKDSDEEEIEEESEKEVYEEVESVPSENEEDADED